MSVEERHDFGEAIVTGPYRPADFKALEFIGVVKCRRCGRSYSLRWFLPIRVLEMIPDSRHGEAWVEFADSLRARVNMNARYLDCAMGEFESYLDCKPSPE